MRMRQCFTRRLLGLVVVLFGPSACFAQATHLEALRDWLGHTEEAGRYLENGNFAKAEERINAAIKEIRPYLPDTRRLMARSYCDLARVLYHQKRYAEAEPLAEWALSVREADKHVAPEAVFQCVYTLGLIQSAQKQHEHAELLMRRALTLQEKNLGPDHVNCILILCQLALVYVEQDKYKDAEAAVPSRHRNSRAKGARRKPRSRRYGRPVRRHAAPHETIRRRRPLACPSGGDPRYRRDQVRQGQGRSGTGGIPRFSLMECDDVLLLQRWMLQWRDLAEFEIVPVSPSKVIRPLFSTAGDSGD